MVFSGIGLPITGVANHLTGMESLTVQRHAWMSAHNVLALMFSVFCVWHIILNRSALGRHLREAASRAAAISRETACAAALVFGVAFIFISHAFHVR